jgi:hypothetical protein
MSEPHIVIDAVPDLWRALRWRGVVALRLPLVDAYLQTTTEQRFNFWRKVCGCQMGALLLLVMLGYRVPAMLGTPDWNWSALAVEAGIALLAALTGKLLAIAGARLLLIADVALFQRRYTSRSRLW